MENLKKKLAEEILANEATYCFGPSYGNDFSFNEASENLIGVIKELQRLDVPTILDYYGIDNFSSKLQEEIKMATSRKGEN